MAHRPAPTTSSPWHGAWLGAGLGLLLATVLWAPARWLAAWVDQATHGQVQLRQARGTLWSGQAVLTLNPDHEQHQGRSLPSPLHWQWGLGGSGLTLQLSSDCCTPQPLQWHIHPRPGQLALTLTDQTSAWPLSMLAGLGAPWNTLQADGQLQWHSQNLRLVWGEDGLRWHGQSELLVQDLASRLSTLRPIGSYRITLRGTDTGTASPQLTLGTLHGPLQLSGQGQWTGERLQFRGEATAEEGAQTALSNLLNIMGRREGSRSLLSLG